MTILLVEDDENKRTQIERFVRESFPDVQLRSARSLRSGLKEIISGQFNLILLDMTMPTFDVGIEEDGGRPQAYAGRELLRQMERRGISIPVIVITGYESFGRDADALSLDELNVQLRTSHPTTYAGTVYYEAAVSGWREALAAVISHYPRT